MIVENDVRRPLPLPSASLNENVGGSHRISLNVSASRLHLPTPIASALRLHLLTIIASCVLVDTRTHTLRVMHHTSTTR